MNQRFKKHVEALEPAFQRLISMEPLHANQLPRKMPKSGIYLFSEGKNHLYVGRSRRLRQRLQYHGSDRFLVASFAFLLAREDSGFTEATYRKKGGRAELQTMPKFIESFSRASQRIRDMDIRFVEEEDSIRQALLEIYAAISLNTKYNKFATT
jgi:hypothetical protein